MIWFACTQCKKVHGRADTSAGALIFCECGQSLRVPWESSAAPPPVETLPPVATPTLEPIRLETAKDRAKEPPPISRRGRRPRNAPIDPNVCFNHSGRDKSNVCADCGLSFCDACVTTFQHARYCAPCKNYRTRLLQRRPESSRLALFSLLLALASGPVVLLLTPAASARNGQSYMLLGLLAPFAAIVAGVLAMRWIRQSPGRAGGQNALGGIGLAVVFGVVAMLLACFGQKLWA